MKRTLADVYEQQEEWQKSAKMLLSVGFEYSEIPSLLEIYIFVNLSQYSNHMRYQWNLDSVIMMTISNYQYI